MKTKKEKKEISFADKLLEEVSAGQGTELPISVIIPVYNSAARIGQTLDSIKLQNYPNLEVIVIDGGSKDRTLEIVSGYHPLISRVYTVTGHHLFEMMNRGETLASGKYITFLYPGAHYLSSSVFKAIDEHAANNQTPDLIYFGSIQRNRKGEPITFYTHLHAGLLSRGIYPTNISGCFFRSDLFEKIGKFQGKYASKGPLDLYCRILKEKGLHTKLVDRIWVDVENVPFALAPIWQSTSETFQIIAIHFGIWKAVRWFFGINHLTTLKTLWKLFKQSLFGK